MSEEGFFSLILKEGKEIWMSSCCRNVLVCLIYKELVGKAGLSLAADGCRVRGTLAEPGSYFRKEVHQLLLMGVWAACLMLCLMVQCISRRKFVIAITT